VGISDDSIIFDIDISYRILSSKKYRIGFPLTLIIALTTVLHTTVLHCEHYSKLIHITAHVLLGVRSRGVHISLVRSLPTGPHWQSASFSPQFTRWSVCRSASPQVRTLSQTTIPPMELLFLRMKFLGIWVRYSEGLP